MKRIRKKLPYNQRRAITILLSFMLGVFLTYMYFTLRVQPIKSSLTVNNSSFFSASSQVHKQNWVKKPRVILDANTADTIDFQIFWGIGSARARSIVYYRQRLGGFVELSQIREVYGIDDEIYQNMLPQLKLDSKSIRKLNINSDNIKTLIRHPYLDYYLAKAIIQYRIDNKGFDSLPELRLIHLFDDSTYNKLLPYVEL